MATKKKGKESKAPVAKAGTAAPQWKTEAIPMPIPPDRKPKKEPAGESAANRAPAKDDPTTTY